jgi:hypothetical protein
VVAGVVDPLSEVLGAFEGVLLDRAEPGGVAPLLNAGPPPVSGGDPAPDAVAPGVGDVGGGCVCGGTKPF